MFPTGSIIICHLVNPTEKFWGVLENLDTSGMIMRGISVESFDHWMMEVSRGERPTLGLATMFVPLFRVERVFLDEQVGEVESYRQRFADRVGTSVEAYLALDQAEREELPPS